MFIASCEERKKETVTQINIWLKKKKKLTETVTQITIWLLKKKIKQVWLRNSKDKTPKLRKVIRKE